MTDLPKLVRVGSERLPRPHHLPPKQTAELAALDRAWVRSVHEHVDTPLGMVRLQMEELARDGLTANCLNPKDFKEVRRKYPRFYTEFCRTHPDFVPKHG